MYGRGSDVSARPNLAGGTTRCDNPTVRSGTLACLALLLASLVFAPPGAVALDATASNPREVSSGPPPGADEDSPGAEEYRPLVDQAVADLAANLSTQPIPAPAIHLLKKWTKPKTLAQSTSFGDPSTSCLIEIFPKGKKLAVGDVDLHFVIVHEVFHCYAHSLGAHGKKWSQEGAAMWAAERLVPGSGLSADWWDGYLETPAKSLFGREEDGIGFFGHLEHVGLDPWALLIPILLAGSDAAAFGVADAAGGPGVVDLWASGLAREPAFGGAWDAGGSGITNTKPPRVHVKIGNGAAVTKSIATAANLIADVDLSADVVTVATVGARGRLRDANGLDRTLAEIGSTPMCTRDDGCVCPEGSAGSDIPFGVVAPGGALLGASGGSIAASLTVQGKSLEDFCKKPGKIDPCLVGTWVSDTISFTFPGAEVSATGGAGAVLELWKNGTGTVDYGPMDPFAVMLPGGLSGTGRITGTASGVVNASKGVVTSLTTSTSGFSIVVDVPQIGQVMLPASAGGPGGALDGTYKCTKTSLSYSFAGFTATDWRKQK